MELLQYFDEISQNEGIDCLILNFEQKNLKKLISVLPVKFRKCYVNDSKLNRNIEKLYLDIEDIIKSYIPDKGNIMAGEFGEILSYFLMKEKYLPLRLNGPLKWRLKTDRNRAIQYCDVVLFHKKHENHPNDDDLIVVVESKMKATNNRSYHPIQNAIDGSIDDSVRRLAITLSWLKDKYIQNSLQEKVEYINRFIQSTEYGEYRKHFKAIAVIDSELLDEELRKVINLENFDQNHHLIIITFNGLKSIYQKVYNDIPKTYRP